jgi:hypothetical protein
MTCLLVAMNSAQEAMLLPEFIGNGKVESPAMAEADPQVDSPGCDHWERV